MVDLPAPDGPTMAQLVSAGVAVNPATTTPQDDPNDLLGRPNGYVSRATFTIPGVDALDDDPAGCDRGGCVEQWEDAAAAQQRLDYLEQMGDASPMFAEYHYVRGELVLRIAKAADPALVEQVRAAFLAG